VLKVSRQPAQAITLHSLAIQAASVTMSIQSRQVYRPGARSVLSLNLVNAYVETFGKQRPLSFRCTKQLTVPYQFPES